MAVSGRHACVSAIAIACDHRGSGELRTPAEAACPESSFFGARICPLASSEKALNTHAPPVSGDWHGTLLPRDSEMRYPDQVGKTVMAEKKNEVYSSEYLGSGTFRISKPKRKPSKLKEIRSKRNQRRSRRN